VNGTAHGCQLAAYLILAARDQSQLKERLSFEQNAGTVPAFFLITIDGSAPGASCLVLGLGELGAFAVNLGRLWTARFDGSAGVDSRGC
jgi:hypothetical protein